MKNEVKKVTYFKHYVNFTATDATGITKKDVFKVPEEDATIFLSEVATIVILGDGSMGIHQYDAKEGCEETKAIRIAYNLAKIESLKKDIKNLKKGDKNVKPAKPTDS